MITARVKIIPAIVAVLLLCGVAAGAEDRVWEMYKSSLISPDGRVIDGSQGDISHSEGQAFGMLFSIAFNDKESFDRLWRWTKLNLGVRSDGLFAWQWGKRPNGEWDVVDYNNASDGDILIAYALLRASEKWPGGEAYREEGIRIAESIRKHLSINWRGKAFIAPGYNGFNDRGGTVVNPSYLISPAFKKFAKTGENNFWGKAYKDSFFLASETCFGQWCLPADWVILTDSGPRLFNEKGGRFGYEAIRILVYLAIEKAGMPRGVEKMLDLYDKMGYLPVWAGLNDDSISIKDAPAGHYAVYSLAAKRLGRLHLGGMLMKAAEEKLSKSEYYSFSLYLLAKYSDEIFQ